LGTLLSPVGAWMYDNVTWQGGSSAYTRDEANAPGLRTPGSQHTLTTVGIFAWPATERPQPNEKETVSQT